jgi:hypothetical protein
MGGKVERVKGIEPSYAAWEAAVLPLNYTRVFLPFPTTPSPDEAKRKSGAQVFFPQIDFNGSNRYLHASIKTESPIHDSHQNSKQSSPLQSPSARRVSPTVRCKLQPTLVYKQTPMN